MEVNLVRAIFIFNSITVTILGLLDAFAETYLPIAITSTYRYGRYAAEGKAALIPPIEVPKRWFKHFYEFAAPLSTYTLLITLRFYLGVGNVPVNILQILDILIGVNRQSLVSPEHTTLALVLVTIHCWKRFYETHYVSIFSNVKINLSHYIVGFVHYVGTISCLIGESNGFFKGILLILQNQKLGNYFELLINMTQIFCPGSRPIVNWNGLTYIDYSCSIIFLWATYKQLICNKILSNLRKNKKGETVTLQHKIPKGDLFEYISSPLQLSEILVYLMLTIILRNSQTFYYIFLWVLLNQVRIHRTLQNQVFVFSFKLTLQTKLLFLGSNWSTWSLVVRRVI
ncbi:polyprenol reductase isoform X1 [Neodiprion virginianus]|uniref:polyprenol reductase isoform X1 n=1 Tax=Neodiprion virginianus TaxID=2961670 RepID=UPI001EE6E029|nr:polyprenol reductase isoform X1 [Neodiprion virginianus]XP_046624159.1 polyprenol reductase isoform X1 [Neodiprion virginianus]